MRKFLLSAAMLVAMTGAATADTCDDEQISHALTTFEQQCNGQLTAYGQTLASSGAYCVTQLETDLQDMADAGDMTDGTVCAAAEDLIQTYSADNNVDLISGS